MVISGRVSKPDSFNRRNIFNCINGCMGTTRRDVSRHTKRFYTSKTKQKAWTNKGDHEDCRSASGIIDEESTTCLQRIRSDGTRKESNAFEHTESNLWNVRKHIAVAQKVRRDLEQIGFMFNACNACVANKSVNGKTHTVRFHMDNLMSSHVDKKVNDQFLTWLNE